MQTVTVKQAYLNLLYRMYVFAKKTGQGKQFRKDWIDPYYDLWEAMINRNETQQVKINEQSF